MKKTQLMRMLSEGEEGGYDAVVVGSGYGGSVAACRMSMAGIKVCLMEKGRRWEAQDFPTDSLKIMSEVRMENQNLGVSIGPKDALFQVYEQNDSLAAVACGLGGGSLVNAGVMVPTPVRARRNPKWPNEWDKCEASAAAMLRIQNVPVIFPVAKVLGEIAEGQMEKSFETRMQLSMNFDLEEMPSKPMKPQSLDRCLACGNCLAGCPYNAKNSTDKNYLHSAIQAGCHVRTGLQVQFVVKNPNENCQEESRISRKKRRWLVFLNETDYISADFVILSAGVFGTTDILFRSQMRGLRLSAALGSGFSCNGNTVASLEGSPAPLNTYGLNRNQLSKIPFQDRPGPAISSSYTSSLGFTIQSAVLPTAYPRLLFKGITTYSWPTRSWLFHGVIDKIKHITSFRAREAVVLNAMGYDPSDGKITFDKEVSRICFSPPQDPLLPKKINAFQKLTKKLGGILFVSRYRSTSVHLLGGYCASSDRLSGVCNPKGQVFDPQGPTTVHAGLYLCDASLIPCSVGINPSFTIATVAEYLSSELVRDVLKYKNNNSIEISLQSVHEYPESTSEKSIKSDRRSMVIFNETLKGYVGCMPCTAFLKVKMNSQDLRNRVEMKWGMTECHPLLKGKVGGYVEFRAMERDKLYVIDGKINLCKVECRTPYTQYMHYRLLLSASSGTRYILEGRRIINPYLFGLYAWRETRTLHVTFKKVVEKNSREDMVNLKGELFISTVQLLKSVLSLEGNKRGRFIHLLLQSLVRTYILQIPRGSHKAFTLSDSYVKRYPKSILHEIKTEDGCSISCRQWKCTQNPSTFKGPKQLKPVLLLNGYSSESFWLPTEPDDFVRTLVEEGHETWLLQTRLHPSHASENFTIEDVGRYDVPAGIKKILELHGEQITIHVVAHCVGGLAIHIALMGGHVAAKHIASLSCTNSSMFFMLNALSMVKMWLPLVPLSMFILGRNKILPLLENSNCLFRHRLLKYIAYLIPRYERCTCNECEVFSGIFGNTFWHENVSPNMHYWLTKESMRRLPMAAFPHLRQICKAGFVIDSDGNSKYLVHHERMAFPTLYISGGRGLLVSPKNSFLANKYMKLHQPGFRHERVVVEGFGHSDLLIGEESVKKVFPHILSHIGLAEEGNGPNQGIKYSKEAALECEDDPYEENWGISGWFSPSVVVLLLFFWFLILVS